MSEYLTSNMLALKCMALEIALLALLREQSGNPAFWDRMDKLTSVVMGLVPPDVPDRQKAEEYVQHLLDSWRLIAGPDPMQPSPPGTSSFDAPPR